MKTHTLMALVCILLCLAAEFPCDIATTRGTLDGKETWGYATVRPKAKMFWWYYKSPQQVSAPSKAWPTILWLQGGPGGSGTGQGNFQEIGPLDADLNPRDSTWLQKADIIFVDSPVGTGFSYVEDKEVLARTDLQVAMDMVELIKVLVEKVPTLRSSPLYLVGESYGAKQAAMIGDYVSWSISVGLLNVTLGGVVVGSGWMSPADFAMSYPYLLHSMSRLVDNAVPEAIRMGMTIGQQVAAGQFSDAYKTFQAQFNFLDIKSGQVNLENLLVDTTSSPVLNNFSAFMNGVIREKLGIIPKNVTWQVSLDVFEALKPNFMRPAIDAVDELLRRGVNVTVYSGQLDYICSTIGAESWVKKLRWDGLKNFLSLDRTALYYCHPWDLANAFVRSYKNLNFYWVLRAGHVVSQDQPCAAVQMIGDIIQSPARS